MRAATVPGAPRIQLYKNNVDGKGASYGSHENYLMARQTTFPSIVAGLTPFFVSRQVVVRRRPGRAAAPSGDEAGYQLSQRSRLHRGRGRPGDHAQARHHQHPRRAARRRRQVPPPARDHRRREPERVLHAAQGRHHRAGARHDREGRPVRRAAAGRAGPLGAPDQPRPDAEDHGRARPTAARSPALDLQRAYFEKAAKHVENTLGADVDADTAEVLDAVGRGARRPGPRPAELRRPPRLAGQAAAAGGLPRARRADLGRAAAAAGRPAVHRRADGQGPLQPARHPRLDEAAGRRGAGRAPR